MMDTLLRHRLDEVASRAAALGRWTTLAICWFAFACVGVVLLAMRLASPQVAVALGIAALAAGVLAVWYYRQAARNYVATARRIEASHPQLNALLLTAVEQQPKYGPNRFSFLQESILKQALWQGRGSAWRGVVSTGRIRAAQGAGWFSLILLGLVTTTLWKTDRSGPLSFLQPAVLPVMERGETGEMVIEPGDTEVERGQSLVVIARFDNAPPQEAVLVFRRSNDSVDETRRLAMSRSLDDPLFAGRIGSVRDDLLYYVECGERTSKTFRASVFEFPRLLQADAELVFPNYTSFEPKRVDDARHITAVEGTSLTLLCRLNKPVQEAQLVDEENRVIKLTVDANNPKLRKTTWKMTEARRLRLHLKDKAGRANKTPPEFVINITQNRPPEIKLAFPVRDVEVSPLEELRVQASVWDDFGSPRFGLTYMLPGKETQDIELGKESGPRKREEVRHLIEFESLEAAPDQLLSYYFWAEDYGPEGDVRRTLGDMYFAEVRPFEEIFRQGQQPAGGQQNQQQEQQGGQGGAAMQLAELQKNIINAQWKLLRRETAQKVSEKFIPDSEVLLESQQTAFQQAQQLAERTTDEASRRHLSEVQKHMNTAVKQLLDAIETKSIEPHRKALPAEQAALQALLKLRSRESEVIRSQRQQQQGGGGGGGNRSQRQLQQLELKNDQNRYETERTANSQQQNQQDQQSREVRQALNRLKELARRQQDMNQQLKELQSALTEAKTEKEREEIRRRLKRLREEQQEILRDLDELRNRVEQSEDVSQMSQSLEQMEQTRENVRRASQSLEEGQVSQALAAGSRAERQLEELKDEFRRRSAGQFTQQMNELRQTARQLDENQKKLSQELNDLRQSSRQSLRDKSSRRELSDQFDQQQQDLADVTDEIKRVIEEAETPEPLLSEKLYDAYRDVQQKEVGKSLQDAQQLLDAGFPKESQQMERKAGKGIENLRRQVEKAAESVLGDEAEALRQARDELTQLARQLDREIETADPSSDNRQQGQREGQQQGQQQSQQQSQRNGQQQGQRDGQQQGQREGQQQGQREGQQQGQRDGQQQGKRDSQQQGQRDSQQQGQREGQQQGQRDGRQQGQRDGQQQSQRGGQQQGQTEGQQQGQREGQQQGRGGPPSENDREGRRRGLRGDPNDRNADRDGSRRGGGLGGWAEDFRDALPAPLTGDGYREWSDRLRDVEEMLDDSDLRAEAARIRDRARGMRLEFKRHSKAPNWNLVRDVISRPLTDLRTRVEQELLRKESKDALAPIDRDPIPPAFSDQVRRYYERLGSGR